jgi:hypothetical protein
VEVEVEKTPELHHRRSASEEREEVCWPKQKSEQGCLLQTLYQLPKEDEEVP